MVPTSSNHLLTCSALLCLLAAGAAQVSIYKQLRCEYATHTCK